MDINTYEIHCSLGKKKKKAQIIIFLIVWEKHIVILSYFIRSLEVILLADIRVRKTCVHVKFIIS